DMDGILEAYVGMFGNWSPDYGVGKDKYFADFFGLYIDRTPDCIPQLEEGEYRRPVRGVVAGNYDNDGDTDIFVPVYGISYSEGWENYLWQNDGTGNFTDVAAAAGVAVEPHGRYGVGLASGASWGDYNNDGYLDLAVANIHGRLAVYRNEADGTFTNMSGENGISQQREWHNPLWLDYDNDGDLDLLGSQWYDFMAFAYMNFGPENLGYFSSRASLIGLNTGDEFFRVDGWGAADYDRDGDMDLAWWGGDPQHRGFHLFRNDLDDESENNSWMVFALVGDGENVNRTAPGSQVRIGFSEHEWSGVRHVETVSADQSMNMHAVHFGLGDHDEFLQVEVRWTGGDVEYWSWDDLGSSVNQWVTLEYGTGSEMAASESRALPPTTATLSAARPNPFNSQTRIEVALPASGHVKLAVYDLLGREVLMLHDGRLPRGSQAFSIRADDLASGIYFVRMNGDHGSQIHKIILMK
ncbi:T9SS type A sorting domain-containing protein, partial [bacterium]|nr:T9SS type A sorting domain-containing protein [bacterium]